MCHVHHTVHRPSQGHRHLRIDLFRENSRPLRDDVYIIVRNVRIRFHRVLMKRNCSPAQQQKRRCKDQKAVIQRKINQLANHYCSTVFSSTSALETTCCPGFIPELISCRLSGSTRPATTSTRRNFFPPSGTYTQSRSCKCKIADAGTAARVSFFCPWNVPVTNIPIRISP